MRIFCRNVTDIYKIIRTKLNFMVRSKVLVTVRSAVFWVITQRVVVIFLPTFGVTYWSYLQVFFGGGGYLTPEEGTDRMPHNVSKNYHSSLRNNPEERSSHPLYGGNLKSRRFLTLTESLGKK